MSPDLVNAITTLLTALVGALVGYLAKRQAPAVPVPVPVVPATPSTDRPIIDLLLKLLAAGGKLAPLIPLIAEDGTQPKGVSVDTGNHVVTLNPNGGATVNTKS